MTIATKLLEQPPSRCQPDSVDSSKPTSVLLCGYFGKDVLTSKAMQVVREAARLTNTNLKFEVLSFNKDKKNKEQYEDFWPLIKQKLQDINADRVFAFGNDCSKAIFEVGHNALDVRRGGGWLSAYSQISVHLFPDVMHVIRNRFRLRWLKEDLVWALQNDPPRITGTMEYVSESACDDLIASGDVVWDTETFGHFADSCFKLLTVAMCAVDTNRVIVWGEDDLKPGSEGLRLIKKVASSVKLSGHNRKYDLLANRKAIGTSVHPRDTGDCTNILAKLLRADGSGSLEELATTIGLVGHKREAGKLLDQANLTIGNVREWRYKPIPTKWDVEHRVSESGRKQKRKVVVESRLPTEQEADQQVLTQLEKRKKKYPQLCGSDQDWISSSKRNDDEMWYSQAFYSPEVRDRYCAFDVLGTTALLRKYRKDICNEPNIKRVYEEMVRLAPRTVQHIEQAGLFIDTVALDEFSKFINERQAELIIPIRELAGKDFNPGSDQQVQKLLYTDLGLPIIKETNSGNPSVDGNTLGKLKGHHEIVPIIVEWRKLAKLQSNYADGLKPHIRDDGAVHCSFNIMGAETGRFSVSTPNMQTIPSRGPFAKMAKSIYKARPGYKFLVFDYKTIEPMMSAVLSGDENMLAGFLSGEDFHNRTAKIISRAVWGDDFETCGLQEPIDPEELATIQKYRRGIAKTIGLAALYGQGPDSMAERANCSVEDAIKAQDAIMRAYPDLKKWIRLCVQESHTTGESWTYWNGHKARRRPIPDIGDTDNEKKSHGEICSYNSPIQGSSHEYLLASSTKIVEVLELNGYDARIILVVHDAIYLEVADDELVDVFKLVQQIMTSWYFGKLKLIVEAEYGDRLSELQSWNLS